MFDARRAIEVIDRLMTVVLQFRMGIATVETLQELDALLYELRAMMKQLEAMNGQGRGEGSDRDR